jgi:hypothetical protein
MRCNEKENENIAFVCVFSVATSLSEGLQIMSFAVTLKAIETSRIDQSTIYQHYYYNRPLYQLRHYYISINM